jgi:SAM-dependent methyltransferase
MCNTWCISFARSLPSLLKNRALILEVGSRTVNGEIRDVFAPCSPVYMGVDIENGEGVDLVLDVCSLSEKFPDEHFDAVVTTEMLEHCSDWRTAVLQMIKVTKIDGYLLLTTRSPGFDLHGYPEDHFRFTHDDIIKIFSDAGTIIDVQDDMTLGFPCGIGVIVKRTILASQLSAWENCLKDIEVTEATSIIFNGQNNLDQSEREHLIFKYFNELVSRREKEIHRLNTSVTEVSKWAQELNHLSELKDKEILRLQKLLEEQTNWALSCANQLEEKNKELMKLQNNFC